MRIIDPRLYGTILRDYLDATNQPWYNLPMTQIAARIVEIQLALNAGSGDVHSLQMEQRRLWQTHFEGQSFDKIAAAAWAFRRPEMRDHPPRRVPRPVA